MIIRKRRIIYSLCDFTGNWVKFYPKNKYDVRLIDIKHGQDVRLLQIPNEKVYMVLAAPPCDHFSVSGAQYWKQKDKDGRTFMGLEIIDACLRFILITQPKIWALENPVGRLKYYIGPPKLIFDPCDYGDPYTKKTCLWGNFNIPKKNPVEPIRVCKQGSWIQKLGGKSERTKELRSATPLGFAEAFYKANK